MKLLLDTHALLWFADDDARLSLVAKQAIENDSNEVWVSIASFWEMAIKSSLNRYDFDHSPAVVYATAERAGIRALSLTIEHAEVVKGLPWLHRDPFDRVLVAQAVVSESALVTRDAHLAAYGVPIVW